MASTLGLQELFQQQRSGRRHTLAGAAALVAGLWACAAVIGSERSSDSSAGLAWSAPPAQRRQLLIAAGSAGLAASVDSEPAAARTLGREVIRAPANKGTRPYMFEKPEGFRQYASPVDPSGFIFRDVNDTYFSFALRAEVSANASTEFKPENFIADYETKFTNVTGSSFTLLKGGGAPDRVDKELGIKYYEVEYVVRTQLGFSFDSLKSLHFLSVFAVAPNEVYVLNCQALDEKWETAAPILRKVADSFVLTGEPMPADQGFLGILR
eukprot:TRINITY_DN84640_c0_g1_i1.p2 TRINITY_DN84640_c0_g1~~TRINITY_DN84640_c0_g1_i1.p2  ORF type:complete len:268 (-),score=79.19 TRINITY_DN84640_c0_g1_i1:104-907(-)